MKRFIPAGKPVSRIDDPLYRSIIRRLVAPSFRFIELLSGDTMIVSSYEESIPNPVASSLAGNSGPIFGDAILCSPEEIV